MGKGSQTTTQNTSTAPDPNAMAAYMKLIGPGGMAPTAASAPYQGYTGQEVAPVNEQQMAGIGNINQVAGLNSPFMQQISASGQPIGAEDIQRYMSPYTKNVINATQADFDVQNQRANSAVTGNAAAAGALGGDRVGVAQALTQEAQNRVQAPIMAGLENTGYNQAVSTAENQQQQALRAGMSGEQMGLQGAQAQIGAGGLEQTTQQAQDTQARSDYYQQQGYPFQVAQWLAGIDTGVGSQMGGTGVGQTTGPAPNPWAQLFGGVLGGAALFAKKDGGRVAGFAGGGTPYTGGLFGGNSWVPTDKIKPGSGPPHVQAPSPQKPQGGLSSDLMKGIGVLGKGFQNSSAGDAVQDYIQDLGDGEWRGGRVKRYATGGQPRGFASDGAVTDDGTFDDRYDAAFPRSTSGVGASVPAFKSRWSDINESPDVDPDKLRASGLARFEGPPEPSDVIPDPGLQKVEPGAVDEWRGRVDRDTGRARQSAAFDQGAPQPQIVSPPSGDVMDASKQPDYHQMLASRQNAPTQGVGSGSAAIDRAIGPKRPAEPADETSALGFGPDTRSAPPPQHAGFARPPAATAPPPSNTDQSDGQGLLSRLGVHMTPELRQGLLQAGLAMMATTRGGPGSFLGALGEAGMTGVSGYNKTIEAAEKQREEKHKETLEDERLKMSQESHASEMAGAPILAGGKLNPAWQAMEKWKQENLSKDNWAPLPSDGINPDRMYNKSSGDVKDVPASSNAAAPNVPQGQFDYRTDAPRLKKGDDVPEPVGPVAGQATGTLRNDAEYYLETGILPKASTAGKSPIAAAQLVYQHAVKNYATALAQSRGLNPEQVADLRRTAPGMLKFLTSVDGRTVVSLGVASGHLDTLDEAAQAMNNSNYPRLNAIVNAYRENTGSPLVSTFDSIKQVVSAEIAKAVVGGQTALADRDDMSQRAKNSASLPQLLGITQEFRKLMGTQIEGKERLASALNIPHEKFVGLVGEKTYNDLKNINKPGGGTGTTAPVKVSSPEDARKLPKGTKIQLPDGRMGTVP